MDFNEARDDELLPTPLSQTPHDWDMIACHLTMLSSDCLSLCSIELRLVVAVI